MKQINKSRNLCASILTNMNQILVHQNTTASCHQLGTNLKHRNCYHVVMEIVIRECSIAKHKTNSSNKYYINIAKLHKSQCFKVHVSTERAVRIHNLASENLSKHQGQENDQQLQNHTKVLLPVTQRKEVKKHEMRAQTRDICGQ